MHHRHPIRVVLVALCALALAAVAAPPTARAQTALPSATELAPIEQVTVELREGRWVAIVTSGLPSGCATVDDTSVRRAGTDEFEVTVTNRNDVPPGPNGACTMIYTTATSAVELAGALSPGTYRVVVNRYGPRPQQTTFSVGPARTCDTCPPASGGAVPGVSGVPFIPPPVYSERGLAQAVFPGGSVDVLEASARMAAAAGVWVQDRRGTYQLLPVDAPAFLKAAFTAAFLPATAGAPNFPTATAVILVASATRPSSIAGALPAADAPPIVLPSTAQISAPSADVVWVLVGGRRLASSGDRGASWTPRGLPPKALEVAGAEIAFVSDREGWVLTGDTPASACASQSSALWHTTDAGATWTALPMSGVSGEQCKSDLSFTDAQRGFLIGHDPERASVIYRTGDGGRSWQALAPLPPPEDAGTSPLQPQTVQRAGDVLLLPVASVDPPRRYVFRSTDDGMTWRLATTEDLEHALGFATATRWIAVSDPDRSRETIDAGKTWHPYATTYAQAAPIPPTITFGSAEVGYATVRGAIQRTLDGGATWSALVTPGTSP